MSHKMQPEKQGGTVPVKPLDAILSVLAFFSQEQSFAVETLRIHKITAFYVERLLQSSERGHRGAGIWELLQKSGESWYSGAKEVVAGMERGRLILEMLKKTGL